MDKLLTLQEVIEGVKPIVEADPGFTYPQQEGEDPRCKCVENDTTDEDFHDMNYDYSDCPWHFNDDNTCLYLKDGTTQAPACVLGHYFVDVLELKHVHLYETKSPERVLTGHGYEVDPRAQRFLNSIQSNQDNGDTWGEAYESALQYVVVSPSPTESLQ